MLSNHKLQTTLEEISDISKIGLALMTKTESRLQQHFRLKQICMQRL